MNTGGGKTLVGLLIAQSIVNEIKGRVLYVCPNNQLVEQTIARSHEIGLFPASLKSDQVWGLARGYPTIAKYNTAILQQTDQILLLTAKGKAIQSVRLLPESRLPSLTIFPNQGIKISFQNYNKIAGVYYAKRIGIDYPKAAITWSLDIRQASFNGYIPEEVFNLEIPSGFEVVPSSKQTIP
jgi:CRISPR/Cas system-associated endonuclease/helicase Cas3